MNNLRIFLIPGILTLTFCCCSSIEEREVSHPIDLKIGEIRELQFRAAPPEENYNGPRKPEWFDPNSYFNVFQNISMRNGYILDYVYWCFGDCTPYLYSRSIEQVPLENREEYIKNIGIWKSSKIFNKDNILFHENFWLEYVQTDNSEDAYIELSILYLLGTQFYLGWHFCRDDQMPICSYESLVSHLRNVDQSENVRLGDFYKSLKQYRDFDFNPTVEFLGDYAVVRICFFTLWGGLIENRYWITRHEPHSIAKGERKALIEYDCGIVF